MQSVPLKPHWAWSQLPGAATYQCFQAAYNGSVYLKPAVPSSIRLDFEMLHRILAQSYFEYELLELAKLQLYLIFEKALQLRYKELYGEATEHSLCWLFRHFNCKRCFECDTDFSAAILQLKNYHAARLMQWPCLQGGSIFWMQEIAACINDLYEDEMLKFYRSVETNCINSQLKKMMYPLICTDGSTYRPCLEIQCLYYNNKLPQPKICIGAIGIDTSQHGKDRVPRLWTSCYAIKKKYYKHKTKEYYCNDYYADGCIKISDAENFEHIQLCREAQGLVNAAGDTLIQPLQAARQLLQQKRFELKNELYRFKD